MTSSAGLKGSSKPGEEATMKEGVVCIVWDVFLRPCQVVEKKGFLRTIIEPSVPCPTMQTQHIASGQEW